MRQETVYNSPAWRDVRARVLSRDGNRCTVARLLGGGCSGTLHVHHIEPINSGGARFDADNLAIVCSRHHPQWEALRRNMVRQRRPVWKRCPHRHVTRESRRQCEARLNRRPALV